MQRGEIYWINFEPSSPPGFGKIRPALIVSNTEQNLILPTIVVVPLSTQGTEIWPLRVPCYKEKKVQSYAVIPGMRQISKARIYQKIGIINGKSQAEVDSALQAYLFE